MSVFSRTISCPVSCLQTNLILTTSVLSYICDEFVLNDTSDNRIDRMRTILIRHPTKGEDGSILGDGCTQDDNEASNISNEKDSVSANGDGDKHSDKQSDRHSRRSNQSEQERKEELGIRQLRPRRKRYIVFCVSAF